MKTKPGWRALDRRDHRRPVVVVRPRRRARSPQVRSKTSFIISIAMSQRTPSHCVGDRPSVSIDGAAQVGRERVQLHDVGPGREVRVAAVGEHAARRPARTRPGRARGRPRSPRTKYSGCVVRPRVVGRDVVRHEVEDQPQPALGERLARRREAGRARRGARRPCSRGCSTASRRRPPCVKSGQRAPEALDQAVVLERDRDPGRAALPDAHQPDRVEAERRDRVPLAPRARRARSIGLPGATAQLVEPDPGVDLVDERVGRFGRNRSAHLEFDRQALLSHGAQVPSVGGDGGAERRLNRVAHAVLVGRPADDARDLGVVRVRDAWEEVMLDLEVESTEEPRQDGVAGAEVDRGLDLMDRPDLRLASEVPRATGSRLPRRNARVERPSPS